MKSIVLIHGTCVMAHLGDFGSVRKTGLQIHTLVYAINDLPHEEGIKKMVTLV